MSYKVLSYSAPSSGAEQRMRRRVSTVGATLSSLAQWHSVTRTWKLFVMLLAVGTTDMVAAQTRAIPDSSAAMLTLPTDNTALWEGDGPAFYMYTDRRPKRGLAPAWNGGRYGFVRNGTITRWGVIYARFHEGIDIKPVRRTDSGEPLDEVRSISDGVVVYANRVSLQSSYGLYVVVEHWWNGSPYYSLYAHLKTISVRVGDHLRRGEPLGLLGYTGRGINRRRAHVHLEVGLLLNKYFQSCYDDYFPRERNHHGRYNGFNLAGVDVGRLMEAAAGDAPLSVRDLVKRTPGFFRVTIPAYGLLDILRRYPWLSPQLRGWVPDFGVPPDLAASWQITFSQSGLPVQIDALHTETHDLELEVLKPSPAPYSLLTGGLLTGSGDAPVLSRSGQRLVDFVACSPPELLEFR